MPRGIPNAPKTAEPSNTKPTPPTVVPNLAPNTKAIEAAVQPVGQDRHLDVPVDGSIRDIVRTDQEIEIVPGPALGDYAAELAFNEELVEVMVHESTDKNAEPIVDLYCNGVPQRFVRGRTQTVKRKYVEILARARVTAMTTVVQIEGDNVINRINKHTALRYPFSIQREDNPKGAAWLRKIQQEA
jgi:hypothetical protein